MRGDYAADYSEREALEKYSDEASKLHDVLVRLVDDPRVSAEKRRVARLMANFCDSLVLTRKKLHPEDERSIRAWFPELEER